MANLLLREAVRDACAAVNNYFTSKARICGEFHLRNEKISIDSDFRTFLAPMAGQWLALTPGIGVFRIRRGHRNSCILDEACGIDRGFAGTIYAMDIPLPFLKLCERIREWRVSEAGRPTNLTGERVANVYAWTAATKGGKPLAWQDVFAEELRPYRSGAFTGIRV